MSHSRIFQVSKNRVNENDRIKASDLALDVLSREIDYLDYVKDSESPRKEDLEWLKDQLKRVGFELKGEKILPSTDDSFLDEWRRECIKAAEELDLYEMARISSGIHFCSFYIYDKEFGYPKPLWVWAKDVLGTNQTFHIGGIIDYHY